MSAWKPGDVGITGNKYGNEIPTRFMVVESRDGTCHFRYADGGTMLADLDDWYPLQDFLSGRPLMTHERIASEHDHAEALLRQFPRLAEAQPPDGLSSWEACARWLTEVASYIGWARAEVRPYRPAEPEGGQR